MKESVRRFILALSAVLAGSLVAYLLLLFVNAVWWAPYASGLAVLLGAEAWLWVRRWRADAARMARLDDLERRSRKVNRDLLELEQLVRGDGK